MSILWCGGEDIDFPNGASVVMNATAGFFRTGYARAAVTTVGGVGLSKSLAFSAGSITAGWLTCQFRYATGGSTPAQSAYFGFGKSGTNSGLLWGYNNGGTGNLTLSLYNGTTITVLATATALLSANTLMRIDMQVLNFGSSGTVNLYLNGVLQLTYTGDLATGSGLSNLDSVIINNAQSSGVGNTVAVSEIIAADEDTRGWPGLVTMAPNANGTTQNWSNPAFTNFNPTTINDANSTFTNTAAQDEQANLIDLPAGTFNIKAVKIAARALRTTGSTASQLALGFNNGGSVAVASNHSLTTAFTTYEDLFATDPTTGSAWVQASMNGLQLDLRSA